MPSVLATAASLGSCVGDAGEGGDPAEDGNPAGEGGDPAERGNPAGEGDDPAEDGDAILS